MKRQTEQGPGKGDDDQQTGVVDQGHARSENSEMTAAGGRRAQIVDATIRLIAQDGLAEVSTRKIAREAAVNLATIHYLFDGKDDLLMTVLNEVTTAMIVALTIGAQPGSGLGAALTDSFTALCSLVDQVPSLPLVRCELLLYASRRPDQEAPAQWQQQRYVSALQARYRAACATGESCAIPFEELAVLISSTGDGLALQVAAQASGALNTEIRTHLLRAFIDLVQAQPESGAEGTTGTDDTTLATHDGQQSTGDMSTAEGIYRDTADRPVRSRKAAGNGYKAGSLIRPVVTNDIEPAVKS